MKTLLRCILCSVGNWFILTQILVTLLKVQRILRGFPKPSLFSGFIFSQDCLLAPLLSPYIGGKHEYNISGYLW